MIYIYIYDIYIWYIYIYVWYISYVCICKSRYKPLQNKIYEQIHITNVFLKISPRNSLTLLTDNQHPARPWRKPQKGNDSTIFKGSNWLVSVSNVSKSSFLVFPPPFPFSPPQKKKRVHPSLSSPGGGAFETRGRKTGTCDPIHCGSSPRWSAPIRLGLADAINLKPPKRPQEKDVGPNFYWLVVEWKNFIFSQSIW